MERFYDKRASTADRRTPIQLYHNWIKAELVAEATTIGPRLREGGDILDLCCGRGGDFGKWDKYNLKSYFGVDTSSKSIEVAEERIISNKRYNKKLGTAIKFSCADAFETVLNASSLFDFIQCQFSIHYLVKTPQDCRIFLTEILKILRPLGCFIVTLVDSRALYKLMQKAKKKNKSWCLEIDDDFSISCKNDPEDGFDDWNITYAIRMTGFVEDQCEFLIPHQLFIEIAQEVGFHIKCNFNFTDTSTLFCSESSKYRKQKMCRGTRLDGNDLIKSGLYCGIVLQKPSLETDEIEKKKEMKRKRKRADSEP